MAGVTICAQAPFRDLWTTALGFDGGDEAALVEWKALRTRYGGALVRLDRATVSLPLLMSDDTPDAGDRQRIAGWVTHGAAEWQTATALLSTEADAARLAALRARFEARFDRWWRTRGQTAGAAGMAAFARLLDDGFFDPLIERAARFYGAELPPGPIFDLYLIVQPAAKRPLQTAEELERWAVVALPEGAEPAQTVDVIVHELCHYLFSRMRPALRAALQSQIVAADEPWSAAALGVIDEALAAAIGNGLAGRHYTPVDRFTRRLARPDGLTNYRAASLTARALLPSLEPLLTGDGAIASPQFVRIYVQAAHAGLEGGPIDYLHSPIVIAAPELTKPREHLEEVTRAHPPYLRAFPAWDDEARRFATTHPLQSIALLLDGKQSIDAAELGFAMPLGPGIWAHRRTPKSWVFALVGGDAADLTVLVDQLAALTTLHEGRLIDGAHR
jgi:hypothetical protein